MGAERYAQYTSAWHLGSYCMFATCVRACVCACVARSVGRAGMRVVTVIRFRAFQHCPRAHSIRVWRMRPPADCTSTRKASAVNLRVQIFRKRIAEHCARPRAVSADLRGAARLPPPRRGAGAGAEGRGGRHVSAPPGGGGAMEGIYIYIYNIIHCICNA